MGHSNRTVFRVLTAACAVGLLVLVFLIGGSLGHRPTAIVGVALGVVLPFALLLFLRWYLGSRSR